MGISVVELEKSRGSDWRIFVPSHLRADTCWDALTLFDKAFLYVHESEVDAYLDGYKRRQATDKPMQRDIEIVTHKASRGYADVINSIFDSCVKNDIRYCAVFDDDSDVFWSVVGNRERLLDSNAVECVVANACQVMEDIEAYFYLFSTCSSIVKYQQNKPYRVGFALPQGSFVARPGKIDRMKVGMFSYEDFDFLMDYYRQNRFLIIEDRIIIHHREGFETGGCNAFRSSENEEKCRKYITDKWKGAVKFFKNSSNAIRPSCTVSFKHDLVN